MGCAGAGKIAVSAGKEPVWAEPVQLGAAEIPVSGLSPGPVAIEIVWLGDAAIAADMAVSEEGVGEGAAGDDAFVCARATVQVCATLWRSCCFLQCSCLSLAE